MVQGPLLSNLCVIVTKSFGSLKVLPEQKLSDLVSAHQYYSDMLLLRGSVDSEKDR